MKINNSLTLELFALCFLAPLCLCSKADTSNPEKGGPENAIEHEYVLTRDLAEVAMKWRGDIKDLPAEAMPRADFDVRLKEFLDEISLARPGEKYEITALTDVAVFWGRGTVKLTAPRRIHWRFRCLNDTLGDQLLPKQLSGEFIAVGVSGKRARKLGVDGLPGKDLGSAIDLEAGEILDEQKFEHLLARLTAGNDGEIVYRSGFSMRQSGKWGGNSYRIGSGLLKTPHVTGWQPVVPFAADSQEGTATEATDATAFQFDAEAPYPSGYSVELSGRVDSWASSVSTRGWIYENQALGRRKGKSGILPTDLPIMASRELQVPVLSLQPGETLCVGTRNLPHAVYSRAVKQTRPYPCHVYFSRFNIPADASVHINSREWENNRGYLVVSPYPSGMFDETLSTAKKEEAFRKVITDLGMGLPPWSRLIFLSNNRILTWLPLADRAKVDAFFPPGDCVAPDSLKKLNYAAVRLKADRADDIIKTAMAAPGKSIDENELRELLKGLHPSRGEGVLVSGNVCDTFEYPWVGKDTVNVPSAVSWYRHLNGKTFPAEIEPVEIGFYFQPEEVGGKRPERYGLFSFTLVEFLDWQKNRDDLLPPLCRESRSSLIDPKTLERGSWQLVSWGTDESTNGKNRTVTLWLARFDELDRD